MMANDDEELSKLAAEPGFVRPRAQETPVNGNQTQPQPELEESAALSPEAEFPETASPEPQSPSEPHAAAQELEPEIAAAAEPALIVPETISETARGSAGENAKPRSLFPALAATAIVGALLGLGGTFGLRFLGGSQINGAVPDERLAALSARIDSIESKVDASASRTALSAIESRAAAAESTANKAAESANSVLADVQKALAARPAAQESGSGSAPAEVFDPAPLEARIDVIEQKLAPLASALAAPKGDLRVQQDRETPVVEKGSHAQAIAIVAQSLLRKLDRGGPFSGELIALENLGVAPAALEPLRAVSASGVSSERQLAAQFATLAPQIIASSSAKQAGEDEGFLDRLTRNAKGMVHIRRVGEPEGTDAPSLVTRIENALADHDVEAALNLWKELPSPAVTKSESWGEAAKARLDALNAARSIEADAVAVLGKSKS